MIPDLISKAHFRSIAWSFGALEDATDILFLRLVLAF